MRRPLMIAFLGSVLPLTLLAPLEAQCVLEPQQKLTAPGGAAYDRFGYDVAVSGDVAVAGSHFDDDLGLESGSVHVYRSVAGTFLHEQKLTASDGAAGDNFGHAVAVDGDRIVVGSPNSDGAGTWTGAAYVFRHNGSSWVQEQRLTAQDATTGDRFGFDVAIHGAAVVVGAPYHDTPLADAGTAYVFRHNGTAWQQEQKLSAPDAFAQDHFGFSVAVENGVAVAGAWADDDGGYQAGSVYVYRFNGALWLFEQKLTASDGEALDYLGWTVAADEFWIVAGAWGDDDAASFAGAAYVFIHDGTNWVEEKKLVASDGETNDMFGGSVAMDGKRIAVGAVGEDQQGSDAGAAYVYRYNASGWIEVGKLVAADGASGAGFGGAVALHDRTVLAGADADSPSGAQSGSAYVEVLRDLMLDAEPETPFEGDPISFMNCGGQPGGVVMLTVIDVDGTPLFLKIALGTFDSVGQWTLSNTVPPGLSGLQVTFFSFGNYRPGKIGGSNFAVVSFQ